MKRPTLYVIGYPRTGTTWLCRLVSEAWNTPIATISRTWFAGHAAEGKNRPGEFIVRHGHPLPRILKTEFEEKDWAVFIYRDPRDVIISQSYYFKKHFRQALKDSIAGKRGGGVLDHPIKFYYRTWLDSNMQIYTTTYELLHEDPVRELENIQQCIGIEPKMDFEKSVQAQAFGVRKQWTQQHGQNLNMGKEYHVKFLRKGIVGDWKNHFNREDCQKIQEEMGDLLIELGYETSPDWWKTVDE